MKDSQKPTSAKKRKSTRRKNPAQNYAKTAKDLLYPAAGILGGQIIANQANNLVAGYVPAGMASRVAPILLPLVVGGALLGWGKNPIMKYLGIGMGASAISNGVKEFAPSVSGFVPMADTLAGMMPGSDTKFLAEQFVSPAIQLPSNPTPQGQGTDYLGGYDEYEELDDYTTIL